MNDFRVRSKVWLEYRGQAFLGDGRFRLLAAVERTGSINAAAKDLGISYRKVWSQLQAMEEHAPFPLLERRSGGRGGGATLLTTDARAMLKSFKQLREQVNTAADQSFTETFFT
ncbi:MAG: LysR family transcriptional regulator [Deltaproteobacteria bacterium]|nr:LysR family transcriptional regulator [Deltaproteobacteria bacterium]